MIDAMGDNVIKQVLDDVFKRVGDTLGHWFSLDWIPEVWFWWFWLFVLFLVLGIVIRFFGWIKFVQVGASIMLAIGAVFVAGGHVMQRRLKKKQDDR